ncbi:hypothetical protein C8Q80DRAFT_1314973, partial [Daedaleopsis nitida]
YGGSRVHDLDTVGSLGIQNGDEVWVSVVQLGGKPVIYLFPPQPVPEATVSVKLVPEWSFTHIYPLTDIKTIDNGHQCLTWSLSADVGGTLVERGTNLELSYLFWEAASGSNIPSSPPLTPVDGSDDAFRRSSERFDPAYPFLEPHTPTSVLLPFPELLSYLDTALKDLSLHTSARNDFITYWLPKLSKQPYVALRFLPQPVYERAAELLVNPKPDVVTRVFMLFRGVPEDEVRSWSEARERAGSVNWPSVVGITEEAYDTSVFRVLDWGAMEVFRSMYSVLDTRDILLICAWP